MSVVLAGIFIHCQDRSWIGLECPEQLQSVVPGPGQGTLVRADNHSIPLFQSDEDNQPATMVLPFPVLEVVVVKVEGGRIVNLEDVLPEPVFEDHRGTGVPIITSIVLGQFPTVFKPDEVMLAPGIEFLLELRGNDIVGWTDNPGKVADYRLVVMQTVERANLSHSFSYQPFIPGFVSGLVYCMHIGGASV